MNTMQHAGRLLCTLGMLTSPVFAQPPELLNARLETATVIGNLSSTLAVLGRQATEPTWVAWSVPMIDGERGLCCGHWNDRGPSKEACRLEGPNRRWSFTTARSPLARVGLKELTVFMRLDKGKIGDLRAFSWFCPIDAQVRREALFWLAQSEDDRALDLIAEILRR